MLVIFPRSLSSILQPNGAGIVPIHASVPEETKLKFVRTPPFPILQVAQVCLVGAFLLNQFCSTPLSLCILVVELCWGSTLLDWLCYLNLIPLLRLSSLFLLNHRTWKRGLARHYGFPAIVDCPGRVLEAVYGFLQTRCHSSHVRPWTFGPFIQ